MIEKMVIIKGMEKPKECITKDGWYGNCPMDRTWCTQMFAPVDITNGQAYRDCEGKIPDWCPLVEITFEEPIIFRNGIVEDGN